ncbi:cobalamin B12-binding domain-containing protein [Clostridium formicaceticum]|uniref:Methionine synthase n=1 Tax=Clostridium formicaceticum TaxID=1497 RepID=A0AAC9RLM4_9CLOT|nr:corrinoid protein [Clostridium formicaceticum]AOY74951.1 methyltransferase [Clostridium formicaceticum]ARE89359.1 Methionine synthase [Clostridium formicaceticum]
MNKIITEIKQGLMDGDAQQVKEKTELALAYGVKPKKIIQQGLLPTMQSISQKFYKGEIFIPDVLMSSRAMHASLYVLQPILSLSNETSKGIVVVGTVAGDLHDIGKNMVSMMLKGAGYRVIDLGIDVPATDFITAVHKHKPDVLAMSALLTTTMGELGKVVMALKEKGLRQQVKIIIGGAPVTPEFAMAVEADAYAADSFSAIEVVNALVGEKVELFTVS